MRIHHLLLFLALTSMLPSAVPLAAQSLADVAAAEATRRKAQKGPSKVYTNDDLSGTMPGSDASSAPGASSPAPNAGAARQAEPATAPASAARADAVDEKKTEAYWRARVTAIQQSLGRTKVLIEAMQSRINALNAEALSADDPGKQAALQADLTTAVSEMARLKQESETQNKDLATVQEEARRANIPPGWLR
ncbi:MAG: hypothetical protein EHM55_13430 [Acidobacteria bacterium]|nr:MAG: hypothetical protein EHM55_13430 [Acidobacteriota bacterium]